MAATKIEIHGDTDAGLGAVVDEFRVNFEKHGEIGASLAVFQHGKPIVDVWAGVRDRRRRLPWERDTWVPVFSTTKGIAALVVAAGVSKGFLDYDARIADYWPEFACHGKENVTLRQLLDHQAGLAAIESPLRTADLHDLDRLAEVLAAEKPRWRPGTRHGYHAISLGFYLNEVFRRAEPRGRTLGQYLADEIAGPHEAQFMIGVPEGTEFDDVAVLERTHRRLVVNNITEVPWRIGVDVALHAAVRRPQLSVQALTNPKVGFPHHATRPSFLTPELPSSNGVGTARGVAKLYSAAVSSALTDLFTEDVRTALAAASERGDVPDDDLVLHVPSRYHLGFRKPHPAFRFGAVPGPGDGDGRAFGTTGIGGSMGFADPATGIGFGYTMNQLGVAMLDEPRNRRIRNALFRAIGA
ncbi:serine hydrolase domain-containing protein [Hoyosella subflava]|uniref:Carboxylesterase n=1 Tax=Hoyosella subflava (strain DSM 45089 / JCM 17490 / NBRC 109087 / DQS3-9A1) TaxID=443218 RepID=F6ERG2_HOYSD|nr:serine hydrolase domain-containing protein [Hoyosella subflava]AEF38482.1 Carboxylesterase [Hoyosella subflava DQS3-9A1]